MVVVVGWNGMGGAGNDVDSDDSGSVCCDYGCDGFGSGVGFPGTGYAPYAVVVADCI